MHHSNLLYINYKFNISLATVSCILDIYYLLCFVLWFCVCSDITSIIIEIEGLSQQVKTWRTVLEEVRPIERLEKLEAGTETLPEA